MIIQGGITVHSLYTIRHGTRFLGFLPVLDTDTHNYYTLENEYPDAEYKRVSPVLGGDRRYPYCSVEYIAEGDLIKKENYKKSGYKGTYEEYVQRYNQVKEHIKNNPYLLIFVGCDDGDTGMRFPDEASAINYISNEIVYFDEVYEDPRSMGIY